MNVLLSELYWKVGTVISTRIERDGWGKSTVAELAAYLLCAKSSVTKVEKLLRRIPNFL
ncbi:MAG: hypothetical protein IT581_08840 [Verrucomicrobiales bacterium]|nr:hypothetical protein [Verrucomicrobiales bacterium]